MTTETTPNRFAPFNASEAFQIRDGLELLQPDNEADARQAVALRDECDRHAYPQRERELAVEKRATEYRERCEAEALKLLKANGFNPECGGGGCLIMSLYLPNGAFIWATNEDGPGEPTARSFCVCVYYSPDGQMSGPLLDLRQTDDLFLIDAIRMALAAARAVDSFIQAQPLAHSEEELTERALNASEAVRERPYLLPDGFKHWTDGIAQEGSALDVPGKGCIILSDLDGQERATEESWAFAVFTGTFDWGCAPNPPEGEELRLVHSIEKGADGLTFEAALAAARAMLDELPAFDPSRSEAFNSDECENHRDDGRGLCRTCRAPL